MHTQYAVVHSIEDLRSRRLGSFHLPSGEDALSRELAEPFLARGGVMALAFADGGVVGVATLSWRREIRGEHGRIEVVGLSRACMGTGVRGNLITRLLALARTDPRTLSFELVTASGTIKRFDLVE